MMESVSYNPLYLQVKDIILKRLADGVYGPGDVLPSESRLAAEFGTSISTIRQAVSILVSDGYLVKKQGKGTFVSDRKITLTFLSWLGESRRGVEILSETIRKFEKQHPSMKIEVIPTTYPDTRKDLLRLITNGNAPDVAQIVSHWTSYFASMGAFVPLDDVLSPDNIQGRIYEKDTQGGMYRDKLYSVSWGLCPVLLIANKQVLRAAGIEQTLSSMTLDEFFETCRKISSSLPHRFSYGLSISNDETDFLRIYTFLQCFGGGFVNGKEEVIFNSPENAAGFQWLRRFIRENRVFMSDIYTIRKRFSRGEIAFISDGPWIKYLLEELTGEDFTRCFQAMVNPARDGATSYSWNYNHALAICSQSKNKMYAAKFIDVLTGDNEVSTFYYTKAGHLPVYASMLQDERYSRAPFNVFREQLKSSSVINAQNSMFEKAMVLCIDAVKRILFEGSGIDRELNEKQYYLKMLYYG
jgi:ABC-type glycerol-3-phosphate transport system substrate-binding protein